MKRLLTLCESLLTYAAVVSLGIMVLLTTIDAAARYLFDRPITGAYDVTEKYLMLGTVFLGLSYAYRRAAFIRVTILVDYIPRSIMVFVNHVVQLFSLCYFVVLGVATIQQTLKLYDNKMSFGTISQPVWPSSAIIPLGLFCMLLPMLRDVERVRKGKSALFKEDSPMT